jgi:hypothetical protein
MSLRAVTAHVCTIRITPPIRRDICAVVATRSPPTGPAQALLDILTVDISIRRSQATKRPSGKTPGTTRTAAVTAQPRYTGPQNKLFWATPAGR